MDANSRRAEDPPARTTAPRSAPDEQKKEWAMTGTGSPIRSGSTRMWRRADPRGGVTAVERPAGSWGWIDEDVAGSRLLAVAGLGT